MGRTRSNSQNEVHFLRLKLADIPRLEKLNIKTETVGIQYTLQSNIATM